MKNSSLSRSEVVTIKVGEKTSESKVINLPKGVLLGVAKFDNNNAPGFLRIGVQQNGVDIIKPIHHKALDKSNAGGSYISQYRAFFIEVSGSYDITAVTDTEVTDSEYKFEIEFVIVDEEQLPYFKAQD